MANTRLPQRQNREHLLANSQPTIEYKTLLSPILCPTSIWGKPQEPTTPKRPPKQPRPETLRKAIQAPPVSKNWQLPRQPDWDTPPASPTHEAPQSQLGLELQSHIAAAVASHTAQVKITGDEVLELVSMVSQKVSSWEERSLKGAATLGKDIRTLVLNFSKSLATVDPTKEEEEQQAPTTRHSSYAEAARTSPSALKSHPKPSKVPYKALQPEKPPRIFLCLSKDHPACQASPHATMEIFRKHLDRTCSAAMREIQQVPSGLAIWPKDGLGLHLLNERMETLETLIQGSKAEMEQTWAVFVLPNAPLDYTGYDGAQVELHSARIGAD